MLTFATKWEALLNIAKIMDNYNLTHGFKFSIEHHPLILKCLKRHFYFSRLSLYITQLTSAKKVSIWIIFFKIKIKRLNWPFAPVFLWFVMSCDVDSGNVTSCLTHLASFTSVYLSLSPFECYSKLFFTWSALVSTILFCKSNILN